MFEIKPEVEKLIKFANDNNKQLYIVGGAVRDLVLGKNNICDFDLVGNVSLDEFYRYSETNYLKMEILNKKLGVVRFVFDDFVVECARMRKVIYCNSVSHNPDQIYFVDDLEEDSKRRDFCCNSLYYDLKSKEIKDFFNGMSDIQAKKIRHIVVDGVSSLEFDPVRILRLVSFSFKLGFEIDEDTLSVALKNKDNIKSLTQERYNIELNKIKKYYDGSERHIKLLKLFNIEIKNK